MHKETNNADRAAWAEEAVNGFGFDVFHGRLFTDVVKEQPEEGDDAYCMVLDLISNLYHLAHKQGWNIQRIASTAYDVFVDECDSIEENFA